MPIHGELLAWHFHEDGRDIRVTTTTRQFVLTNLSQVRRACLARLGLAWLPSTFVSERIAAGDLMDVLGHCRKIFEPYHLYYSSRRQKPPALAAFIQSLRQVHWPESGE
ncbi:LysR family transcriptional regulator [Gluconobacter morbifer G707]|uniref:LysR family transcriptional regulator n=1 Tax=Gluconobacter morbifer G707 TaxID=1088869 RepID=G6XK38_9PROT|nr:LysR family transcriptional regulator [Gluconobacter morbifer G707]